MAKIRRVAVAINLSWPYRHHLGVFSGIQRYARDHKWQYILDPFVEGMSNGRPRQRFDGIVGRATRGLAQLASP